MTIEEAIIHAKAVADGCNSDRDCAYQHDQLAGWLEELVALRKEVSALHAQQEAANDQQIRKALRDNGFETVEQLLEAYRQMKTAQKEAEKNGPLTLEELREMDGRPVYIVPARRYEDEGWAIVRAERKRCEAPNINYYFPEYGVWWLAYRRPPEGENI